MAASRCGTEPYYLDVTHPKANKGGVVKFFSTKAGSLEMSGPNGDVLMFVHSGLSIAVGQSGRESSVRRGA